MGAFARTTMPVGSCSRDPIGYFQFSNFYEGRLFGANVDPAGTTTFLSTKPAKALSQKNCGCCCCIDSFKVEANNPIAKTTAAFTSGRVDMKFSVKFSYKKRPTGLSDSDASCLLAFLEFPVKGSKLPTNKVKYEPGKWNDPARTKPEFFKKWTEFDHPNANPPKCDGKDDLDFTDVVEVYFNNKDFVEFYQAASALSARGCGCPIRTLTVMTHIRFDSTQNPNPKVRTYHWPPTNPPTIPSVPNPPEGMFPLPNWDIE